MSNSIKILLSVVLFIVCLAIGFYGVRLIKMAVRDSGSSASVTTYSSGGGGGSIPSSSYGQSDPLPSSSSSQSNATIPQDNTATNSQIVSRSIASSNELITDRSINPKQPGETTQKEDKQGNALAKAVADGLAENNVGVGMIVSVSKPVYDEATKTYTFETTAAGNYERFVLADSKKNFVLSQTNGYFTVQPTSLGKYYVYVEDAAGHKSDYYEVSGCVTKVNKITKEELQRVLNTGDSSAAAKADFKNRIKAGCKFTYEGRNESEGDAPMSYNEILQRIKLKTWSSVTVKSVRYNSDSGKLTQATIKVNY